MHIFALVAAVATTMTFAITPAPDATDDSIGDTHCVLHVVGQRPTGELVMDESRCFDSFSEAMAFASGGAVELPATTKGSDVFVEGSAAAEVASNFTIGIHYDGYSGSGSSISIVGSSCTGGWWNTPTSWDNRISSSYNGCAVLRYYNYPNKSQYLGYTSGVGTTDNLSSGANNKAESVSYSSS